MKHMSGDFHEEKITPCLWPLFLRSHYDLVSTRWLMAREQALVAQALE